MPQPEQSPFAPRPKVEVTPGDHPGIGSIDVDSMKFVYGASSERTSSHQDVIAAMPNWGAQNAEAVSGDAQTVEEVGRKLGRNLDRTQQVIGEVALFPSVVSVPRDEAVFVEQAPIEQAQTLDEIRAKIAAQRAEREQSQ